MYKCINRFDFCSPRPLSSIKKHVKCVCIRCRSIILFSEYNARKSHEWMQREIEKKKKSGKKKKNVFLYENLFSLNYIARSGNACMSSYNLKLNCHIHVVLPMHFSPHIQGNKVKPSKTFYMIYIIFYTYERIRDKSG